MKSYLGIDVGTSSLKVIWLDASGQILGKTAVTYAYSSPKPGWREIDPVIWFEALKQAMQQLFSAQANAMRQSIDGIGVTGQMHTTVFLDGSGESIRPAIMWNDVRTESLLSDIRAGLRQRPELDSIAAILSTGSPAMNLYWLRQREPQNFNSLKTFLISPDYIVYRLTGKVGTDFCEASTSSLYDLRRQDWSPAMRDLLGLPQVIYPVIKGSAEIAGLLTGAAAAALHIPEGVPVFTGTGDNAAAAYANGIGHGTDAVLSLGTSGVLVASRNTVDLTRCGKHIVFSLDGQERQILVQGVLQSVGRTMSWWVQEILCSQDFEADLKDVDWDGLGQGRLLFYPHLMGDKTIYHDMSLRGAFLGLSTDTSRGDMQIAIMEGIAFGVRELIERMGLEPEQLTPLRVTGGGAKNCLWLQILADVLDLPILQLPAEAGAGYGVALLARDARGGHGDSVMEEAMALQADPEKENQEGVLWMPRQEQVRRYRRKYRAYQKIHDALQHVYSVA